MYNKIIRRGKRGRKSDSHIFASALFLESIQISLQNSKGKEFDGFQIILKLEICAEKIVFSCSTLKKNRLLFVTFKKQRRRERVKSFGVDDTVGSILT